MRTLEIRPLYEVSNKELEARIEALKAQGLARAQIAETPEGKEHYYRNLSYTKIMKKIHEASAAGVNLWSVPEYLEHVRRRQIDDMESIKMANPSIFGGKE